MAALPTIEPLRLILSATETDGDALSRARRALRGAGDNHVLVIAGDFSGPAADPAATGDWIGLLSNTFVPVVTIAQGPVGSRGLVTLLASDQIVLGPDAVLEEDWRNTPALPALAHRRLGPLLARRLFFGAQPDILDILLNAGMAARSSDPDAMLDEILSGFGSMKNHAGHKRALKAAAELPFAEALTFGLWLHRSRGEQHP
jgi:hypothetical protein